MKILVANNRFFPSGGPEQYLFNAMPVLESRGFTVVPFSLAYKENLPNPYSRYFPPPPLEDFVLHRDRPLSLAEKAALGRKVVFDRGVESAARRVLVEERIDLVYALQIAHYLYPEILLAARKEGVPVVWRQSDFQLICPAYNSFRDEAPCTLCDKTLLPALRYRCLKGSFSITSARVLAMWHARMKRVNDHVARFICPSAFLRERLLSAGFPAEKLALVPTPVRDDFLKDRSETRLGDYVLFVGGFFRPKGAHVAVSAARGKTWKLLCVGDASTPEGRLVRSSAEGRDFKNVEFTGPRSIGDLKDLYRGARAVLVPSLWHENAPNVVLEAQALGKAVIASDLGSLREMITHGKDGLLAPPGKAEALADAVELLMRDGALAVTLGSAARERVRGENGMEAHIALLEKIFRESIGQGPEPR